MAPTGIVPTLFVVCAAVGSTWRAEILKHEAHLFLAIAVPLLPVVVAEIPLITVLKALLNAVK